MHDIKFIRNNPEEFDKQLARRSYTDTNSEAILALDADIRKLQTDIQELLQKRKEIAKKIGQAKSQGNSADEFMQEAENIKSRIPEMENSINEKSAQLNGILEWIPNLLQEVVPRGTTEDDNVFAHDFGTPKKFDFDAKEHFDLGENLGLMDFEVASKISGSRFVVLKSELARLERALANFMLDTHQAEFGYQEIVHPSLVKDAAMFGTNQLPKFREEAFKTSSDHWLIPTSEVYLTNLVANSIINENELPMRMTAYSQCFRSEAGSAGKDTRGMIRQHQFSKVELVSIVKPEDSLDEHDRMLSAAENILKKLELPYRVMLLCAGDTGFGASKTFDIEVWLPGQNQFREISSCSNCLDFQARRMNARYKSSEDKKNYFVHTLNGSCLAVGRTIVAILENYQNADGSIEIPEVLVKYMNGTTKIG